MAHRFGATPAHTYATKVRWLVGCLLSLIGLLITAFVIVAQTRNCTGSGNWLVPIDAGPTDNATNGSGASSYESAN